MKCPKCSSAMEKVQYESIEVDRCTECRGLWFDSLEHEHLKAIEGSEEIDIGDPQVGKQTNIADRIECPVCDSPMIHMEDKRQRHILLDSCPVCYGVFFDAGEFRAEKQKEVLDFFGGLYF